MSDLASSLGNLNFESNMTIKKKLTKTKFFEAEESDVSTPLEDKSDCSSEFEGLNPAEI